MMDPHEVKSMVSVMMTSATGGIEKQSVKTCGTKALRFIDLSGNVHVIRYSVDANVEGQSTLQENMDDLAVAGNDLCSFILPITYQDKFSGPLYQSFFERLEGEVQIA
jgi:hypothetical protein